MQDNLSIKPNFQKTVVIALTLLLGTAVLSGCAGDLEDPLVGVWYQDDDMTGMQLTSDGSFIEIEDGVALEDGNAEASWAADGDTLTVTWKSSYPAGSFECADGEYTISGEWVNDGEEDCMDGSDEGVDTSGMEMDSMEMIITLKIEISGDVMFYAIRSMEVVGSDQEFRETVDEEALCSSDNSECGVQVRASALSNVLFETAVGGEDAPDWWIGGEDDCGDMDDDGVCDEDDAFPMDPDEHSDSDGDGIGDNADQD